jgi:hypothetical protein
MNYELKEKITATEDFLNELATKSWQDIDHLQAQITNIADGQLNDKLKQLYKNLLTSYYVFVGGVEMLLSEPISPVIDNIPQEVPAEEVLPTPSDEDKLIAVNADDYWITDVDKTDSTESDPFEFYVDFDDPIGDPLTDDDLYNN